MAPATPSIRRSLGAAPALEKSAALTLPGTTRRSVGGMPGETPPRAAPVGTGERSPAVRGGITSAPKSLDGVVRSRRSSVGGNLTPAVDPLSVGVDPKILREYEAAMRQLVRKSVIPGCASVVLRNGQVVHSLSCGHADLEHKKPFTLDTMCRLVCMTKSYIATAFMTLCDEGRADLEDRLDKYLPCFADVKVLPEGATKPVEPTEPLRLKHIISHTSGIGYAPDFGEEPEGPILTSYAKLVKSVQKGTIVTLKDFVEKLSKVPLLSHPGETYEYGFSMDVLGRVVEVILGKDLENCLEERVFQPLGMHSTRWHVHGIDLERLAACYAGPATWGHLYGDGDRVPSTPKKGLVRIDGDQPHDSNYSHRWRCKVKSGGGYMGYTHGGLVSTVADTVRFVQMLVNNGMGPDGRRLLKEKTLAVMERNRLKSAWGKGKACYLGNIGVFRDGGKEFGMGGAACTYWSVDRKDGVACIWFTQHMDMPEFADLEGVNSRRADLWQTMYDAVRSKTARRAVAKHHKLHLRTQAARRAVAKHHKLHVRLPKQRAARPAPQTPPSSVKRRRSTASLC